LIGNLLDYSRLAQSEIHPQRLTTSSILAEVVQHILADSSIRVPELTVDPDLPEVVGDRVLLRQIFSNLLSNAVKFVPPGVTPRVRVAGERQDDGVVLSVVDNGIGIPEESQSRLFRVFERLGDAKDYPGTGIGLAIVRRAVERMGGVCGVESAPARGSRFWVRLPAAEPREGGRP
jgi:signal transduction histidine kinase